MLKIERITQALGNDPYLCREFLKEFILCSSESLVTFKDSLDKGDEAVRVSLHKYRGMILNIYESELENLVNLIEADVFQNSGLNRQKLFQKLEAAHASKCSEILRYLDGLQVAQ